MWDVLRLYWDHESKVSTSNIPRDTYREMITNGNFTHHNIRHMIRICGVNMVNDRRSILCNTRLFGNQLCKTVYAVESGPFQIARYIFRGKRYTKVSKYEYFWKLIDSRFILVFIYIYPVLSRIRRSIYEVNQEQLCVSKINLYRYPYWLNSVF